MVGSRLRIRVREAEAQVSRNVAKAEVNSGRTGRTVRRVALALAGLALLVVPGRAQTVVPTYTISTAAGNGTGGYTGDSGAATSAEVYMPSGMAFDSSGNLYFADQLNHRVRKIDTSGTITTVAGNGTSGYTGDGSTATSAELNAPCGVAVDSSGNVYIADTGNHVVRKVSSGNISTIAGNHTKGYTGDTSTATKAELDMPVGVAVDSSGNVYIADSGNNVVREVTVADGYINTVVGNGYADYFGDNIPALSSSLNHPLGIFLDGNGHIFIADQLNQRIRKVDLTTKIITTVAGNGIQGFAGDGAVATNSELQNPSWVTADSAGNLYIADMSNNVVRFVGSDGLIHNIAGNRGFGTYGDGGPALQAAITFPLAVAVNAAGKVYVAQGHDNLIRLLTPNQVSSTGSNRRMTKGIEVLPRRSRNTPASNSTSLPGGSIADL